MLPSMFWWSCWFVHLWSWTAWNICFEEVSNTLRLRRYLLVFGMRKPKRHISKRAVAVSWRKDSKIFKWGRPDPAGCSKWKWRPFRTWNLQILAHNLTWGSWESCLAWMASYSWTLLNLFKWFQPPQGPHSGAIQMCSGWYFSMTSQSLWRPANVARSPSSLVNLRALRPILWTASVKGLCWLA